MTPFEKILEVVSVYRLFTEIDKMFTKFDRNDKRYRWIFLFLVCVIKLVMWWSIFWILFYFLSKSQRHQDWNTSEVFLAHSWIKLQHSKDWAILDQMIVRLVIEWKKRMLWWRKKRPTNLEWILTFMEVRWSCLFTVGKVS